MFSWERMEQIGWARVNGLVGEMMELSGGGKDGTVRFTQEWDSVCGGRFKN